MAVAQRGREPGACAQLKISWGLKGDALAQASHSSCSSGALMRGCTALLSDSALNTGRRTVGVSPVCDSGL